MLVEFSHLEDKSLLCKAQKWGFLSKYMEIEAASKLDVFEEDCTAKIKKTMHGK